MAGVFPSASGIGFLDAFLFLLRTGFFRRVDGCRKRRRVCRWQSRVVVVVGVGVVGTLKTDFCYEPFRFTCATLLFKNLNLFSFSSSTTPRGQFEPSAATLDVDEALELFRRCYFFADRRLFESLAEELRGSELARSSSL